MKKGKFLLPIMVLLLLSVTGCKKYSEGPAISFRSKTDRVANNWKVALALENGKDVTADYNKYELNLTKSGGANLSAKYVIFGVSFDFDTDGTWAFVSDKEKLALDFANDDADAVYVILKLTEDEMWLKQDDSTLELHLVTR